jgi:hypothetical protein
MSKFCGSCGAPLIEGAGFCGSCGATALPGAGAPGTDASGQSAASSSPVPPAAAAPAYQPVAPVPNAAAGGGMPVTTSPQQGSPWVKILVGLLIFFVACGALAVGVVIYVGHKVSQKAHEYSAKILGDQAAENAHPEPLAARVSGIEAQAKEAGAADSGSMGDVCALLSKEDVSHAIGIPIASTKKGDDGCSYLALGTAADMAAKHAAAMVGAKGADKKTQSMFEQFAGGVLKESTTKDANDDSANPDGTVVVLNFSVDPHAAEQQIQLNRKIFGGLGGEAAEQDLDGIGDEAFVAADSMIMVRKGEKLIKIMYMGCPCATDAVKPLAKKIADKL